MTVYRIFNTWAILFKTVPLTVLPLPSTNLPIYDMVTFCNLVKNNKSMQCSSVKKNTTILLLFLFLLFKSTLWNYFNTYIMCWQWHRKSWLYCQCHLFTQDKIRNCFIIDFCVLGILYTSTVTVHLWKLVEHVKYLVLKPWQFRGINSLHRVNTVCKYIKLVLFNILKDILKSYLSFVNHVQISLP